MMNVPLKALALALIGACLLSARPAGAADPRSAPVGPLRSATKTIDPCTLGTPDQLRTLISGGMGRYFPLKHSKDGEHITISSPKLTDLKCPNLRVTLLANIRYQKTQGFPQFSTSGEVRFTSPVVARVNYVPGMPPTVNQAAACLTNIDVTGLNLNNVPNWLDNTWVRQWLNSQLANRMCFDVTSLVRLYVQQGGKL